MLHFLQTQLSLAAAARHIAMAGFPHTAAADESFVLKTVLTEALGGAALRPWRVEARSRTALVITGYSELSAEEVERRRRLALPSLQAAVGEILGYLLPEPQPGERLRLTVRLCPTLRVTPGRASARGRRAWSPAGRGVAPPWPGGRSHAAPSAASRRAVPGSPRRCRAWPRVPSSHARPRARS
jgi:hypothetical protein